MANERNSPLPWKSRRNIGDSVVLTVDGGGVLAMWEDWPERVADAEFIVRACNNHEPLLAALKAITPPMPPESAVCHSGITSQAECAYCGRIRAAHEAIAKAEGR